MKVRRGFVSNSSSSSFVVAFPKQPESVEELRQMMFGKQEWHYDWISESDVPVSPIVERVFAKIGDAATEEEVYESIQGGYFDAYLVPELLPGYADYWKDPDYKAIDRRLAGVPADRAGVLRLEMEREVWDKLDCVNDERARQIAEAFISGHKGHFIAVMEFSDNDDEAVEEHTNIFQRLPHIRTSYH